MALSRLACFSSAIPCHVEAIVATVLVSLAELTANRKTRLLASRNTGSPIRPCRTMLSQPMPARRTHLRKTESNNQTNVRKQGAIDLISHTRRPGIPKAAYRQSLLPKCSPRIRHVRPACPPVDQGPTTRSMAIQIPKQAKRLKSDPASRWTPGSAIGKPDGSDSIMTLI